MVEGLERKLEKPDLNQWRPLKGPFLIEKAQVEGKPTITGNNPNTWRYNLILLYHMIPPLLIGSLIGFSTTYYFLNYILPDILQK